MTVFRLTDRVVPSKACAFFDKFSSTADPRFGFSATSLGDPIVTQLS